jgi:hypothetical protein
MFVRTSAGAVAVSIVCEKCKHEGIDFVYINGIEEIKIGQDGLYHPCDEYTYCVCPVCHSFIAQKHKI